MHIAFSVIHTSKYSGGPEFFVKNNQKRWQGNS